MLVYVLIVTSVPEETNVIGVFSSIEKINNYVQSNEYTKDLSFSEDKLTDVRRSASWGWDSWYEVIPTTLDKPE